jgi:hypothetical protein
MIVINEIGAIVTKITSMQVSILKVLNPEMTFESFGYCLSVGIFSINIKL